LALSSACIASHRRNAMNAWAALFMFTILIGFTNLRSLPFALFQGRCEYRHCPF
jgi:hypothetical protein